MGSSPTLATIYMHPIYLGLAVRWIRWRSASWRKNTDKQRHMFAQESQLHVKIYVTLVKLVLTLRWRREEAGSIPAGHTIFEEKI